MNTQTVPTWCVLSSNQPTIAAGGGGRSARALQGLTCHGNGGYQETAELADNKDEDRPKVRTLVLMHSQWLLSRCNLNNRDALLVFGRKEPSSRSILGTDH